MIAEGGEEGEMVRTCEKKAGRKEDREGEKKGKREEKSKLKAHSRTQGSQSARGHAVSVSSLGHMVLGDLINRYSSWAYREGVNKYTLKRGDSSDPCLCVSTDSLHRSLISRPSQWVTYLQITQILTNVRLVKITNLNGLLLWGY